MPQEKQASRLGRQLAQSMNDTGKLRDRVSARQVYP